MKSRKRRLLLHLLKPLWELADVLEKIPSSMPNDMKARLKFGAAEAAIFIAGVSGFFYVQLGTLAWAHFLLIVQCGLLAGAAMPYMGLAQGVMRASRQAAIEAGTWKRQMLEGAEAKALPPATK